MNAIISVKEGNLLVVSDRSLEYLSSEPIFDFDFIIYSKGKSVNSFCFIFLKLFIFLKSNEIL